MVLGAPQPRTSALCTATPCVCAQHRLAAAARSVLELGGCFHLWSVRRSTVGADQRVQDQEQTPSRNPVRGCARGGEQLVRATCSSYWRYCPWSGHSTFRRVATSVRDDRTPYGTCSPASWAVSSGFGVSASPWVSVTDPSGSPSVGCPNPGSLAHAGVGRSEDDMRASQKVRAVHAQGKTADHTTHLLGATHTRVRRHTQIARL